MMRYIIDSQWDDGSFRKDDCSDVEVTETEETLVFFIPNDCGGGYRITVIKK